MLTRRRSTIFLQDTINRGAEFVDTLKIAYPKADSLNGKDFDWLFDCPQTEQFLEWFCNTVGEENVLSPAEVEAYEKLVLSEKPVLEDEALEQVLKTCRQSCQLQSALQRIEALPLNTVQQETEVLKHRYACLTKRHNKLQVCAASLKQKLCHLAQKEEKASRKLEKAHLELELNGFQSNHVFGQVSKIAKELVQWYTETGHGQQKVSMAKTEWGHFLELEENVMKDFLGFFPKILPLNVHGTEAEKRVQLLMGSFPVCEQWSTQAVTRRTSTALMENKAVICGGVSEFRKISTGVLQDQMVYQEQLASQHELTQDALQEATSLPETVHFLNCDEMTVLDDCQEQLKTQAKPQTDPIKSAQENSLDSYKEELERMEMAYMSSQGILIMTSAEIKGICASLQWASKTLKAAKENKMKEEDKLCLRRITCPKQLHILHSEICQMKTQSLMPLLQGSTHLLRLPVVCGELELEAITLANIEFMQKKAAGWLMGQLSQVELLRLLLMTEEMHLHQMGTKLEEMASILNESQAQLLQWQSCSSDKSRFSIKQCPRTLIDPSDLTTCRLWEMLDKYGQEKQLFRTYENLASQGSRLCQELRMLQEQLGTQFSQLPKLVSENEVLHSMMYGDSNQLMLHAQELSEPLEQLSATQAKLYQMLMDTLSNVKTKRKSLCSHFQQTERSLYIQFFNEPKELKKLIQELEEQVLAFSEV